MLGSVRLRSDGVEPLEVPERKVRALLAALIVSRGETVPAEILIDRVWGEELPGNPQRVLQAKLSQLRALLDQAADGGRELLVREPGGYRLTEVRSDADELRRGLDLAQGATDPAERLRHLGEALDLWQGRPYGEFADELWASAEVAALEELRLQGVELQASALVETGRPEAAYSAVRPLLDEHPTREALVSAAMHACYLTRRQPEALRLYERLRTHLAEELGVDPGAETQELFQGILRQDPQLTPARAPAVAVAAAESAPEHTSSADRSRRSLPRHSSAYIGREQETTEASELLDHQRLVTVLGIGGVGKTRLATAAACRAVPDSAEDTGSAWFVDLTVLAPETPPGGVARSVAAVLELPGRHGSEAELIDRVASALEECGALLVLDNCEHLIDAAAAFTADLLSRTEHVRVLATSREPLGLAEEQRLPLTPLAVENTPSPDGSERHAPAVELFLARARAVAPHVELGDADVADVAELCRRLDGLPMAIELAAGRMNMLSVQDLLDRITDRLDLFARPGRGGPRRQQTLRGMLDWSWELLEEPERALLRRLAVHPVSWTLDTIESVCADDPGSTEGAGCWTPPSEPEEGASPVLRRAEVLPLLARLVDRSLVSAVRTENGSVTAVRYRLLETVAAYAGERLEASGERRTVAARHISYHRAMVECAQDFLFGPHARDWVRWIGQEEAHLDHALGEALRTEDGGNAVALTLSTFWHRWMTGQTERLGQELAAVAACPGPRDAAHAQVAVLAATTNDEDGEEAWHTVDLLGPDSPEPGLLGSGALASNNALSSESGGTRRWCERVLEALGRFDDDEDSTLARMQVQWFAATPLMISAEHREVGERLADEAIDHLLAVGDLPGAAFAATQRDWFLLDYWGARPRGLPGGYDAETVLRARGDDYGLTQVFSVEYLVAEIDGETGRAQSIVEEALRLATDLGFVAEAAYWEAVRALQKIRAGELQTAADGLEQSRRLARQAAFGFCMVIADAAEAVMADRRGEPERAEQTLSELSAEERRLAHRSLSRVLGEQALPAGLQLSRT